MVDASASTALIPVKIDTGESWTPKGSENLPGYFLNYGTCANDRGNSKGSDNVDAASENFYSLYNGTRVAVLWIFVAMLIFYALSIDGHSDFLAFGPTDSFFIVGNLKINTWPKWACLMFYSGTSQMARSYVSNTLKPFMNNVIRDHKSKVWQHKETKAAALTVVYTLFFRLYDVLDLLLTLTLQVQFYIPAMICDVAIATSRSVSYIRGKDRLP